MVEQPAYRWNVGARRYIDQSGRFVPTHAVNDALQQVVDTSAATMRGLTQQLIDGKVSLADWQLGMAQSIKDSHVAAAALGVGGWDQASQGDWGWTGQRIREQYDFLTAFAGQIADGTQPLDGTALARAELYAHAATATHREMIRRLGRLAGDLFERNRLGPADHCAGDGSCLGETAKGVVPIGTLLPVGGRACMVRCHCTIVTLATAGAEEAA